MAAQDNPYYIAPANPLQALMAGTQGFEGAKKQATEDELKAGRLEAVQALQQGGDIRSPLAKLIGIGDTKGAEAIATYAKNEADQKFHQQSLGETARMNTAQIGNMEQQRTFQGQQLGEAARHNKASEGLQANQQHITENAPIIIPYGGGIANKKGEILREPSSGGLLDKETLSAMADQYRAGDTSVMANLGRGAQGAENIVALRKIVAEKNAAAGQGGADQAIRNAEYGGVKSGQRTLGTKQANIEMASTEFEQVLPIVAEASKAVSRTNYPDLNKIIQSFEQKTGDPAIVKFGGGINTLVNLYARAISPSGVGTVSDKEHAREILQKAWSQGQFDAATGMMQQEIQAAKNSPEKVRDEMRKRFLGGQGGAAAPQTPAAAPSGGLPALPPGFQLVK